MCSNMAPGGGACSDQDAWTQKHRFGLAEGELAVNFPFSPYSIQLDFMRELYECVSHGKMGLFESPTGTGEDSSLQCSCVEACTQRAGAAAPMHLFLIVCACDSVE